MSEKNAPNTSGSSALMLRTFRRLNLYRVLLQPSLLQSIVIDGHSFQYNIVTWDEYWTEIPPAFRFHLENLKNSWKTYLASRFAASPGKSFSRNYLNLVKEAVAAHNMERPSDHKFLFKILGFENFVFKFKNPASAFAAATASFRSPLFLSFCDIRKNNRNDPILLPLLVALDGDVPELYYHYRKHRLLKNTDENLLLFPAVNPEKRPRSFGGLQFLATHLFSEWDSRIEQRAHLLVKKVIVPLLKGGSKQARALRILDIGSGAGLFTSKIIAKLIKSAELPRRKIEVSLLDILTVDPKKYFASPGILRGVSRIEYISFDYKKWMERNLKGFPKFDFIFLFRILHNLSGFQINTKLPNFASAICERSRYRIFPHLSDYYQAISHIFPLQNHEWPNNKEPASLFYPDRVFNPSSLLTADGESIFRRLMEIGDGILIEDGDLAPQALVRHLSDYPCAGIKVYDLSQQLRLSINHIYWITRAPEKCQIGGQLIWPK